METILTCRRLNWYPTHRSDRLPKLCRALACSQPHMYSLLFLMPVKPPRRRIPRIQKSRRVDVRRDEFNEMVDLLNDRADLLNRVIAEQKIQFMRIAQLQVELDRLKLQQRTARRKSRV